jgi:hypothetical protein
VLAGDPGEEPAGDAGLGFQLPEVLARGGVLAFEERAGQDGAGVLVPLPCRGRGGPAPLAPALITGLLVVGCSHASSGATTAATPARTRGSVTEGAAPFCSFLTSVNAIAARAASQQQGIQLLASIVPRLQAQHAAPAAVAADFGIVMTAAEQSVAQGNLSPLATNQVASAGTKLTNYCHSRS